VLVVAVGATARTGLAVADLLAAHDVAVTVADPRWPLPVPEALVKLAGAHDHVVTLEDGLVEGGVGSLLSDAARRAGVRTPVQSFGVPRAFLAHASREQLVAGLQLGANDIAGQVLAGLAPRD
jgi:1-deoxy-D-xylulose-5-phosphate synthase